MSNLIYNPPPEIPSTPGKPTPAPPPRTPIAYNMQYIDPSALGKTVTVKPGNLANQQLILEKLDKILGILERNE